MKVASLVCVYNETPEEVLLKNLSVQSDVFILDDSTKEEFICKNIELAKKFNTFYIHRKNRHGFKGGAINNWLRLHGKEYDYFGIFDSDSIVGKDFYERIIKHFTSDEIAYVQAKIIAKKDSSIARLTGDGVEIFYTIREKDEYVLSCGHNVVFRYIPSFKFEEGNCEDFRTSLKLFSMGYRGVLANDVTTYESVPGTWYSFAMRSYRWANATTRTYISNLKLLMKLRIPIKYKIQFFFDMSMYLANLLVLILNVLAIIAVFSGIKVTMSIMLLLLFLLVPNMTFFIFLMKKGRFYEAWKVVPLMFFNLSFILRESWGTIKALLGIELPFIVTEKERKNESKKIMIPEITLSVIFFYCFYYTLNPSFLIFAISFLMPIFYV